MKWRFDSMVMEEGVGMWRWSCPFAFVRYVITFVQEISYFDELRLSKWSAMNYRC
jgi:hypothetical protein